ncbi:MAG: RidA family protein [Bacteroidetes bacterium]|nr:RidA family protein [Bacteroidota bacterium]
MKKAIYPLFQLLMIATIGVLAIGVQSCNEVSKDVDETVVIPEKPEYFLLRPELEKTYGYSHAVRIGNDLKISGAVSMDNDGNLIGEGDMELQMKNCYSDLEKVLKHYRYTFDDVVVENVYTTDMAKFFEVAEYRNSIYTKQFPTGTWLEVNGLALPGQLIEIELEAYKSE